MNMKLAILFFMTFGESQRNLNLLWSFDAILLNDFFKGLAPSSNALP